MKFNSNISRNIYITLFIFSINFFAYSQTNYYLSASGNDSNNGKSIATPWKTLTNLNAATLVAGDVVYFEKGSVFNGFLNVKNNGVSGNPILFTTYGTGNKPIIRSSTSVNSWTLYNGAIWKTTLSAVLGKRIPSLFVNTIAQQIGREPNFNPSDGGFRVIKSHTTDNLSISESTSLPYPADSFKGGEVTIRTLNDLIKSEIITSHSGSTVNFSIANATLTSENVIRDNYGYFFQNHINALDQEGEWAHDISTNTLYLYSSVDPNTLSIEYPSAANTLVLTNRKFIEIQGLQFENAQSSVITMSGVGNITINNCNFNNGNDYIALGYGPIADVIYTNNTITNCNNVGFRLEGCSGVNFSNNSISDIGMRAGMGGPSYIPYTGLRLLGSGTGNQNVIERNTLKNIGYHGINFGGDKMIVQYNEVSNYCYTKDDGGGIYTVNNQGLNNLIYKNIIHDAPGAFRGNPAGASPKTAGIYIDNNSQNQLIKENTIYNVGAWGIMANLSSYNEASDNTVYNCKSALVSSSYANTFGTGGTTAMSSNNTFLRNILFSKLNSQYCGEYTNSITGNNFGAFLGTLDYNYYCQPFSGGKEIKTIEGAQNKEYLLSVFKTTFLNYEANGKSAPLKFSTLQDPDTFIRFEVNATGSSKVVSLGNKIYKDAKNVFFTSDITLLPYTSIVLLDSGTLSVEDFENSKAKQDIVVYPNPTTDFIKIEKLSPGDNLKIIDISGKILHNQKVNFTTETIDVSQYSPGLYILNVGNKFNMKIIKK
jgi:parallel beta-helix repeat protein